MFLPSLVTLLGGTGFSLNLINFSWEIKWEKKRKESWSKTWTFIFLFYFAINLLFLKFPLSSSFKRLNCFILPCIIDNYLASIYSKLHSWIQMIAIVGSWINGLQEWLEIEIDIENELKFTLSWNVFSDSRCTKVLFKKASYMTFD